MLVLHLSVLWGWRTGMLPRLASTVLVKPQGRMRSAGTAPEQSDAITLRPRNTSSGVTMVSSTPFEE